MTHCYNCGHTGTFVLLAQFALAVPGPVADRPGHPDREVRSPDWSQSCDPNRSRRRRRGPHAGRSGPSSPERDHLPTEADLPGEGDLSLAVQCPVCDSTDVGLSAADLLARYGSSTAP